MTKTGRIAKNTVVAQEPRVDEDKLGTAMVAMRDQAQEGLAELCELAGDVRGIQIADITVNFLAAARIRLFERVRESKRIKDLPLRDAAGNLATARNLEEFCPLVFGRSYQKMVEESSNLEALGELAYEQASRLGLNRSSLRAARALPPEKLELVRVAISNGSTKGEILSVIEDLAEKVETAEKQVVELQGEKEAADQLVEAKNKTIDKLQREVKRFEKLPPDEKLEALLKDCTDAMNDARGSVLGRMRQAFLAVANAGDDRHAHDMFLAGLVGQLQAELNELRDEFNLVVVGGEPEWERWAKAQELAKTGKQAKAN